MSALNEPSENAIIRRSKNATLGGDYRIGALTFTNTPTGPSTISGGPLTVLGTTTMTGKGPSQAGVYTLGTVLFSCGDEASSGGVVSATASVRRQQRINTRSAAGKWQPHVHLAAQPRGGRHPLAGKSTDLIAWRTLTKPPVLLRQTPQLQFLELARPATGPRLLLRLAIAQERGFATRS